MSLVYCQHPVTLDKHCNYLFQTTDSTVQNGIPLYEQILMSGFPHTLSADELKQALPEKHSAALDKVMLSCCKSLCYSQVLNFGINLQMTYGADITHFK